MYTEGNNVVKSNNNKKKYIDATKGGPMAI